MSEIYYPECDVLVSGGKDSLTAAKKMWEAGRLRRVILLETGIAVPGWKDFVLEECERQKWNYECYRTDESYEALVMKYGFPGPGKHGLFMNYLKGRCIRKYKKANPTGILASGVRCHESQRRFGFTKPVSFWEGVPILAPVYDMVTDAVWSFFRDRGLRRSPAYSTIQMSGDCVCGAFADEGEDKAIEFHYPTLGKYLLDLGASAARAFPGKLKAGWGWGWRRPRRKKRGAEAAVCVECGDQPDEQVA